MARMQMWWDEAQAWRHDDDYPPIRVDWSTGRREATGDGRCPVFADDEDLSCPIGAARCVLPAGHDPDHVFEARPAPLDEPAVEHRALERKVQVTVVDVETGDIETSIEYMVVCAACVPKYETYRPWPWHRPVVAFTAGAVDPG